MIPSFEYVLPLHISIRNFQKYQKSIILIIKYDKNYYQKSINKHITHKHRHIQQTHTQKRTQTRPENVRCLPYVCSAIKRTST